MSMVRILFVAFLPAIFIACADQSPTDEALAEIDSPEALAAQTGSDAEETPTEPSGEADESSETVDTDEEVTEEPSEASGDETVTDATDEDTGEEGRLESVNLEDFEAYDAKRDFGWVNTPY